VGTSALHLALIHRSSWNRISQKSISTNLHSLPLWERRMAYFPALVLSDKHKIWEERINIHCGER
jgi:hypothetical protein